VRNIIAALVLSPILFKFKIKWKAVIQVAPVSLLLMTTGFCTLVALKYLSAVTVITVVTTTPAIVAILNQRLGRDTLAPKFWLGFCLSFIGVVISLEYNAFVANPIGLICVFVAVVSSSLYRVSMESLSEELSPLLASALSFVVMGLITLLFVYPFVGCIPGKGLPIASTIGFAAAVANVAFITALNRVGATRISIIAMVQRPLLIGAAAIFLQEQPTPLQLFGILLVIVGMNSAKVTRIPSPAIKTKLLVAQTEP
jgi:drug/metabolite transporter (DMT)-like permease